MERAYLKRIADKGLDNALAASGAVLIEGPLDVRHPSHKEKLVGVLIEQCCADLATRTEEFLSWIKRRL